MLPVPLDNLLFIINFELAKTTDTINVHEITVRMISETPSLFSKSELSVLRYDTILYHG